MYPGAGSATKLLGQCYRIFIELDFLQHAAGIGDTWLHVQPPLTSVAEQFRGCRVVSVRKIADVATASFLGTFSKSVLTVVDMNTMKQGFKEFSHKNCQIALLTVFQKITD